MKSYYKQAMKKYYISCTILSAVLIALWIIYTFCTNSPIGAFFFLIAELFIIRISIVIIVKCTLLPVLSKNLDAVTFKEIVNNKHFVAPLFFKANAALANGDYQTVIDIASLQISNKKTRIRHKYYYLSLLARSYFELRDFTKLDILLKKHDELKELNPSKKFFNAHSSKWDYYRHFLKSNFETCQVLCKSKEEALKTKKPNNSNYDALVNSFYYAVACYSAGNIETAQQVFDEIIHKAPQMQLSTISQRYVDSINATSELTIIDDLIPQKNYQPYDDKTIKKIHRHKAISVILIIFVCALTITFLIFDFLIEKEQIKQNSEYISAIAEYEKNLNNAIANKYDHAIFVKYFNVTEGTQHIDTFCLIEHENGLDLASIVTYNNGESLDFVILIEDIQIPNHYSVKSAVSNNQIECYISDGQLPTSKDKELIEFSVNNKNYWIEIKSIIPLT